MEQRGRPPVPVQGVPLVRHVYPGILSAHCLQVMDKAIDVHDRIMRGLLSQYCGFEVRLSWAAPPFKPVGQSLSLCWRCRLRRRATPSSLSSTPQRMRSPMLWTPSRRCSRPGGLQSWRSTTGRARGTSPRGAPAGTQSCCSPRVSDTPIAALASKEGSIACLCGGQPSWAR